MAMRFSLRPPTFQLEYASTIQGASKDAAVNNQNEFERSIKMNVVWVLGLRGRTALRACVLHGTIDSDSLQNFGGWGVETVRLLEGRTRCS